MVKKKFILAMQPHESRYTQHTPYKNHTSIALGLLLLMGLAFSSTTPGEWQKSVEGGLLKYAYGWQNSPLIASSDAAAWYYDFTGKVPKTGCNDAREKDWAVICPMIQSQGMNIDCANANPQGKAEILRNIEKSKTTRQYWCLYG